jgi:uncharacterized protein DUF6266
MCAVIQRGILGGFRNKIGNVVGTSWKGIAVMKSLPLSVANPQTAAQTAQRAKFGFASKFASALLVQCIKPLWDRFAQKESGYNAFIQTNIDSFTENGLEFPLTLQLSKGTLAPGSVTILSYDASSKELDITWDATPGGDANPTDLLYIAITNSVGTITEGLATGSQRSEGAGTYEFVQGRSAGQTLYCWFSWRKADGTKVSNSIVGDTVIVA